MPEACPINTMIHALHRPTSLAAGGHGRGREPKSAPLVSCEFAIRSNGLPELLPHRTLPARAANDPARQDREGRSPSGGLGRDGIVQGWRGVAG